jgi:hypothetical protein
MTPVNNKSMLAFLFDQMEKLDDGRTDIHTAREQANLAKQVNNAMKYELDRSKTLIKISEHNAIYKENIILRNIESKNYE